MVTRTHPQKPSYNDTEPHATDENCWPQHGDRPSLRTHERIKDVPDAINGLAIQDPKQAPTYDAPYFSLAHC
jgi:hypothetical protein